MAQQMTKNETPIRTNGLDLDALTGTLEAVKQDPSIGSYECRATNQWINGG